MGKRQKFASDDLMDRAVGFVWDDSGYFDFSQGINERDNSDTAAGYVMSRFSENMSFRHRSGIDAEMHQADHDLTDKYTASQISAFGEGAPNPPIHKKKYSDYQAVTSDIINGFKKKNWSLSPTPIPNIPESLKRSAAEAAYDYMITRVGDIEDGNLKKPELMRLVSAYKKIAVDYANERAAYSVAQAERAIADMLAENGWEDEYKKFYDYAAIYPYAVMGVEVSISEGMSWNGDTLAQTIRATLRHRAYNPHMVFPSPDVMDSLQECDNVCILEYASSHDLMKMRLNPAFDKKKIDKILDVVTKKKAKSGDNWTGWECEEYNWARPVYEMARAVAGIIPAGKGIPIIRFNGLISGYQIKQFDGHSRDDVDDYDVYEVEIYIVADQEIRFEIDPYLGSSRPIVSESYQSTPDKLMGESVMSLMRDPATDYKECYRLLHFNSEEAVVPIVEYNSERLVDLSEADEEDHSDLDFSAGTMHETKASEFEGNSAAIIRRYGDDKIGSLLTRKNDAKEQIDDFTDLPSHLVGFSNASSGNRTTGVFRSGLENSLKKHSDFVGRVDDRVVKKLLSISYHLYLAYNRNDGDKYEATAVVNGSIEQLRKDQKLDQTGLVLQTLTQATQYRDENGQPLINADLYRATLIDWLEANGRSVGSLLEDPRNTAQVANIGQPPVQPQPTDTSTALPQIDGRTTNV